MNECAILFRRILLFLVIPFCGAAFQPYTPKMADPVLEPWRWRHEDALDGLNVLCMDEALDGTLWFGNVGSIASYDGLHVTTVSFDEELLSKITPQEGASWAKALRVLPNGELLVLINQTLVLRRGTVWRVIIPDVGTSVFSPKMIQCDDGAIWLMASGNLWRMKGDFSEVAEVITASEVRHPASFCLDASGTLWIVEQTARGQFQLVRVPSQDGVFKEEERKTFEIPFRYDRGDLNILARSDGTLVVASGQHRVGLHLFDPKSGRWTEKSQDGAIWAHYALLEGQDGSVWVGQPGALSRLTPDNKLVESLELQFELPPVNLSMFEASNKRMWIIGRIGQVCSVDLSCSEWITYPGLHFEFETSKGVEWFRPKSVRQVVSHDKHSGEWRQYGLDDGLVERTYMLFNSSHGLVWAVGSHQGRAAISVFDGVKWTRQEYPEFAELILPNGAFESSDGTVWFGAQGWLLDDVPGAGGALQFRVSKTGSVELLKHHSPPAFPYYVTAFAQTPDETLWLGSTVIHSLNRDASIQSFPELQGENTVAMTLDREQSLWVAKEHFGVCRWRRGVWEVFDKKDGLPDLNLSDILALPDGSVLVASSQAISRFDGTGWSSDIYPQWFGMSLRWSSLKKSPDGSIWFNYATADKRMSKVFPEIDGYCAIRHCPETAAPDTHITDYLKRVSQPGNTHIRWTAQDVWLNTPLKNMQYSWRLDEGDWSAFSHDSERTFLSLSNGRHVLEVRARDKNFNVDPVPDRIEFAVIPPVWKQAWFITLISILLGLIAAMVWILIRTRERNSKERQAEREAFLIRQQQEREELLLKQQEEQRKHHQEMDRLKTGFFTNISHELRTPMTVVSGRLEMICNAESDEQRKNSLSIVLRNAQRVSTLITQLLDFRKIEEGKIKVETTRGDLAGPLRDWVASLQVLAERAGLTLSLDVPAEFRGEFDFDKLQKIFTNLIANSIKYTKCGGEVRVVLRNGSEDDGMQRLIFAVEDTGEGIPSEHLDHIFDRFYRVSEASMAAGAGIGLDLTKELVDLLGGEIQVESPIYPDAEGPGTRFTVRLPMNQDVVVSQNCEDTKNNDMPDSELGDSAALREDSIPCNASCSSDGEPPLILVVEDDEDVRTYVVDGLEESYKIETAENGRIGLQKATALIPDLIVTDLMMPVMGGIELCRVLKTSLETSHIPVIMLTAKTALDSQIEGLKTGADDYITKPFHMELLQVRIANLLESRRVLREKFCNEYPVITPKMTEHTPDAEFLQKCLSALAENGLSAEFGPDGFAGAMSMSLSSLYRKLKAVAGKTPAEFVREYRMMRGAELLDSTTLSITEIAFQVGCDDSSHFSRMFKAQYKMSPKQYRTARSASRNTA